MEEKKQIISQVNTLIKPQKNHIIKITKKTIRTDSSFWWYHHTNSGFVINPKKFYT